MSKIFSFRWKSLNQTNILHFNAKFDLKAWHDIKKILIILKFKKNKNWCKIRWQIVFMIFCPFCIRYFFRPLTTPFIVKYSWICIWKWFYLLSDVQLSYFFKKCFFQFFFSFFTLDKSICICWFEFIYLNKITLSNKVVSVYVEGIAISSFFYLKKIRSYY